MYVDNFVFAHFQGRYNITATINQSTNSVHAYTYVFIINKTIKHIHVLTITLINNNYILRNDPSISYGNFLSINIISLGSDQVFQVFIPAHLINHYLSILCIAWHFELAGRKNMKVCRL